MSFKIIELTKDNESKYLNQVADLEEVVLHRMEQVGQIGQLFTTGAENILQIQITEKICFLCMN